MGVGGNAISHRKGPGYEARSPYERIVQIIEGSNK